MSELVEIQERLQEYFGRTGERLDVRLRLNGGGCVWSNTRKTSIDSWDYPAEAMKVIRRVTAPPLPTKKEAMEAFRQISLAFSKFCVVDSQLVACSTLRRYIEAREDAT